MQINTTVPVLVLPLRDYRRRRPRLSSSVSNGGKETVSTRVRESTMMISVLGNIITGDKDRDYKALAVNVHWPDARRKLPIHFYVTLYIHAQLL